MICICEEHGGPLPCIPCAAGVGKRGTDHYEKVDHPTHYNLHPAGIECIDVIEFMPHNIGAAIKYLWRAGLKPGEKTEEDIKKALWYIERQRTINERVKR